MAGARDENFREIMAFTVKNLGETMWEKWK